MTWISVTERLPELGTIVLLWVVSPDAVAIPGAFFHDGRWIVQVGMFRYEPLTLGYRVTHWQPLPAPPEADPALLPLGVDGRQVHQPQPEGT